MKTNIRVPSVVVGMTVFLAMAVQAEAISIWGVSYNRTAPSTTTDQLLRFDSSDPKNVVVVGDTGIPGNLMLHGLDFDRTGNLYAYANDATTFTAAGLYGLNTSTGQATFIGNGGVGDGGSIWDLSFDPVTNTMYGIGNTGSAQHTKTQFYSIDLNTGTATKIGDVNPPGGLGFLLPAGMGTDATGTTYILDTLDGKIDRLQGLNTFSLPNTLGFNPFGIYGMTIDWSGDGTWYIAGQLNYFPQTGVRSPSQLYTVDPINGVASLVDTVGPTGGEYGGPGDIAIRPSPEPVPEPASMLLLGTGLVGLAGMRRKRHNSLT